MATKREKDIMVYLEKPVHDAIVELARKLGYSASGYLRQLAINDMRDRGIMTDRQIADMATAR